MNLVDLGVLALIALSALFGAYRGFLRTAINTLALLLCMVLALWVTPTLSRIVASGDSILTDCLQYTEGASRIESLEDAASGVDQLSDASVAVLVEAAQFTAPVPALLQKNIEDRVYKKEGLTSVEEYFNRSLEDISLNLLSCCFLVLVFYLIACVLIACVDSVLPFPVLAVGDGLAGLLVGLLRGVFLCMVVFLVVPVGLAVIPSGISLIEKLIGGSTFFGWFIAKNFLFRGIHGTV